MKLEQQVCTLKQAKYLMKLGITQVGNFAWKGEICTCRTIDKSPDELDLSESDKGRLYPIKMVEDDMCPYWIAFTVGELGLMLPNDYATTPSSYSLSGQRTFHTQYYKLSMDEPSNDFQDNHGPYINEAEARAAMLIHLLENEVITAEEVNKRLQA
jgi:hypothetical protein